MPKPEYYQYGLIGLGVMGRNLALNLYAQNKSIVTHSYQEAERADVRGSLPVIDTLPQFLDQLERPRTIFLMVTAGDAVDQVLAQLLPLLDKEDVVIDGGNSLYKDTARRVEFCQPQGVHFMGVGVSGGEVGARQGASLMVGGDAQSYARCEPLFLALACEAEGEPCCGHMGSGGAGHFVKMIHNGIEYGIMQLLAEAYDFMQRGLRLEPAEIEAWFASQVGGVLDSYLLDITVAILSKRDDLGPGYLLEQVRDQAGQKGTGQWSSIAAMELGVPAPTILAAVTERQISALAATRTAISNDLGGVDALVCDQWQTKLCDALYISMLATFDQGLQVIQAASKTHQWGTDVVSAVRLWRGGCIIRARLLNDIIAAADVLNQGQSLLQDANLRERVANCLPGWRSIVSDASSAGLPMPASAATLAYVDSLRSAILPTRLIQAQRDCFGAHTFQRVDRPGIFHADWLEGQS